MSSGRSITKDEFFYVVQDNYDEHAELSIPYYRAIHHDLQEVLARIWAPAAPLRFLDLGAGTGKTAGFVLSKFPRATLVAIDLFEEMLEHARHRLSSFGDRVSFAQGDFMEVPLGEGFDVCISALAIHHQTPEGKKELFEKILCALKPGGRFFMVDWTKFRDPALNDISLQISEENVRNGNLRADFIAEWIDHWRNRNIPETIDDLCCWLRGAGFLHADCITRHYGISLIQGVKAT